MKDYVLMEGNEAIAEAALRAGCRFYAGYPITPQSEILEYMSKHMEDRGGVFVQGENEISSMSMVWGAAAAGARCMTSSSGPGFDLKQEGISYLSSYHIPCVIADVMRYGTGDGEITAGQDSYWLAVKGGGHGDSRQVVFAPASVKECAEFTYEAFDVAEEYRNVVLILSDGAIAHLIEKVQLPEAKEHDMDKFDWTITGKPLGQPKNRVTNLDRSKGLEFSENYAKEKIKKMQQELQRWEDYQVEDAELILVAYGISSRACRSAVDEAREQGLKLGMIRPQIVWPFPRKAFENLPESVKGLVTVEMSLTSQLGEDVCMADKFNHKLYSYLTGMDIPQVSGIIEFCQDVLDGKIEESEVL